jgi:hypothetical protein
MVTTHYTRSSGQRLTYVIRASERGGYSVYLGEKEMLRGRDRLAAGGQRGANKRKAAGAIHEATQAIERLAEMDES